VVKKAYKQSGGLDHNRQSVNFSFTGLCMMTSSLQYCNDDILSRSQHIAHFFYPDLKWNH